MRRTVGYFYTFIEVFFLIDTGCLKTLKNQSKPIFKILVVYYK
ncbi:hypothetical protein AZO1586I_693 [Bathymodiolus thermophilus thioautotrophic gill symbiont]|uniref:Uncharacterized protein n=1 Tax=Bathymodiolus thermophilus thioautotrophic gill symbiont TaxID=2360 RepID=A0ABM8M6I6_9GAMM|nr:hypothetical protein AZO1586I_693 [Bathymodiolus thermophilus thioautotrophic gill symbiont]